MAAAIVRAMRLEPTADDLSRRATMRLFQVALTGDFLNADAQVAYGDIGLDRLAASPHVAFHFLADMAPRRDDADYWRRFYALAVRPDHILQVDGLIVLRPYVQASAFANGAERLVVIGRSGAGYDKIDLAACTAARCRRSSMCRWRSTTRPPRRRCCSCWHWPSDSPNKNASHVPDAGTCKPRRWEARFAVERLASLGWGTAGRELARLVTPFEMRIVAYSPHAEPAQAAALGIKLTSLEQLLEQADFVSLHARLTSETRRLIGAGELAQMKPSAYLINVARGELIDQSALVDALRRRAIAGAAARCV